MRTSPIASRRSPVVAGLLLAGALIAGCSGNDTDATSTTTTVSTTPVATEAPATTATSPPAVPVTTAPKPGMSADEIAVRNVIDRYHYEHGVASGTADPDRSSLLELTTGTFRATTRDGLTEMRSRGRRARRSDGSTMLHRTESVRFTGPDAAVAVECLIDDFITYDSSGTPVNTDVVNSFETTTVIREPDGRWRISDRYRQLGGASCPGLG